MKQILLFLLLLISTFGFNQGRIINLDKEHYLTYLLTSTGDGTGVSTLTVTVSKNTIFTFVDGAARFYSDAGGTLDESITWMATTGAARTRYIKCTTGVSNMTISGNTIISWGAWTSGANAASLSGDISRLTALTGLNMGGNITITGNFSLLPSLTFVSLGSNNSMYGSIAALTGLTYFSIWGGSNEETGSVSALTLLTVLESYGSNTLSNSIEPLTLLTFLQVAGSNGLVGDLSIISDGLTACTVNPGQMVTYTSGGDWSSIVDQGNIVVNPAGGYGLDEDEVDLFIIEVEDTRAAGRHLHLTLQGSNAPRTAVSDAAVAAIIADGGTVTTN